MTDPTSTTEPASAPTVTRTWTCVLFDLDSTLTDSAAGITSSLAHTFETIGLPVPAPAQLVEYVGPPLLDSLQSMAGLTEAGARDALTAYRAHYAEHGALDSAVFPGIRGLLQRLSAAGVPLAVATSKPETQAVRILEHFGLAQHFEVIAGATDESRSAKADVVAEALRRLTAAGVGIGHAVMVGDRLYDVEGAAAHGLPTILVEWGYGSPAEAAGEIAVVHSTDQLSALLLG
ncbi:haloacid dehalogenase [Leifsonia xyli subsp. xyli]|uniref:Hydrolase, haloacid dehalogenase-like family n=2 Tax=Leifsonia xyli subsp. xyli TaxID=59736 RepID=Q6AHG9_LEIXX|nr:HAD hydrolase-like protein [Leifsonia xyli]AAT88176.1 hydrolase, haloacid dehalogenase-like family [Leifsonia xyli subsp. xyli str. CTCB07]ODA90942.1 haloacid dehalogenase [Leifsonia xyli subsp. xyli]